MLKKYALNIFSQTALMRLVRSKQCELSAVTLQTKGIQPAVRAPNAAGYVKFLLPVEEIWKFWRNIDL